MSDVREHLRPAVKSPIALILYPFQEFVKRETSGGILLFLCTVLALVWANSPWAASYFSVWDAKLTFALGPYAISKPLILWINDGLMAIFFFVVGLEIKREILVGELRTLRAASLPVAAALGGMVVPALLYTAFNLGKEGSAGWGIPMATDIAFALGVLQLLGNRVPIGLKVFLTAYAIVDDLGAVLVIALFYTEKISAIALGIAAALLLLLFVLNRSGVRRPLVYSIIGFFLWFAFLKSGIHATIAGVLAALAIPAWTRIDIDQYLFDSRSVLDEYERAGPLEGENELNAERQASVYTLEELAEAVQTPLQRLEHSLHPWVAFLILPIFALANAGVNLSGGGAAVLAHPVSMGIIMGLVLGKFVGITLFSWAAVASGMSVLPASVTWRHVLGVALLGGIGFTMSLFVANLAFGESPLLTAAKIGILAASVVAGILGTLVLLRCARVDSQPT